MTCRLLKCRIVGNYYYIVDGMTTARYEVKVFKGTGKTLRLAKYAAVKAAIANFEKLMPGEILSHMLHQSSELLTVALVAYRCEGA